MPLEGEYNAITRSNLRTFMAAVNYKINPKSGSFETKEIKSKLKEGKLCHLMDKLKQKKLNELQGEASEDIFPDRFDTQLKNCLKDNQMKPNAYIINELCELFNFPIEKIYSPIKISLEEAQAIIKEKNTFSNQNKSFAVLSPEVRKGYFGDFYGYSIEHHPRRKNVIKFKLSIYLDDNSKAKADYTFYNTRGKAQVFSGVPYLTNMNAIVIEMMANDRYQYLYFNGMSHETVIYKSGICVRTSRASANAEPDVKNFVITKYELPEDIAETVIPGLLKMSFDSFYITAPKFELLKKNDKNIMEFFRKNPHYFELVDDCVYLVNEEELLQHIDRFDEAESRNAFEILMKIKAESLAPNRVKQTKTDAGYNYFKQFR